MKRYAIVLGWLAVLAAGARAEGEAAPAGGETLHFRIAFGPDGAGGVVAVRLEESGGAGTGYDRARLDENGDGAFETTRDFPLVAEARTGREFRDAKLRIERDGAVYEVDLFAFRYRSPAVADGRLDATFRWSVTKGEFYAWFINGRMTLSTSADAAAEAPPIVLGPPLAFRVGATTRGPDALLEVGLRDANGATLRLARLGKETRTPTAVVAGDGLTEPVRLDLAYG